MKSLVLIPARLGASRLPEKPLADIHGRPMILHVWMRAVAAQVGPVVVATDSVIVRDVIVSAGGQAIMTDTNHSSGSDRIYEALTLVDPQETFDVIVNLQGDLPTIDPQILPASLLPLKDPAVDIATLVAEISSEEELTSPNVVKMIGTETVPGQFRCIYFTRATAPTGVGPLYHHIGLYAYRRSALKRFVQLPPSKLEVREKLEQLRAIEAGMRIDAVKVDCVPLGVDTVHDLERARIILSPPDYR
ncbi:MULTISPECIES: 3-deoxy-manno-octulosonate cytidylyltransferase [unclassified Methylobacterium]|uniref:3-deoxy-manno-octulosonate cytidylyltransferase n=1 Tax=unclassified Methylobacterium TaxID=2615210 RepID=UPI000712F4DC|nr:MULTISPECIES: 3-deoxy-manno-octulosonate cytidylyltransferase [unclassified Methylobacterium]KQO56352.1 3-deoxy-manno-octulosonate cytidylyltransferase [Methylobacterium sp. Leaf86]KQO89694.1 3-deoxy-manno-octulosonate cytidylyltransferase [Methylobacterium sp. Leaf91]